MILTLTLNPAVDVMLTTDRIIYDDRIFITSESYQAGGKGINAARVLHRFGAEVESIATFGGATGQRLQDLIAESRIPATLAPVEGETRRNLAIVDSQGLTIKLDQRGAPLEPHELERIESKILKKLPDAEWLTLNGSLPPGAPAGYYARLIDLARRHGVKTLLDTAGEALELGLAAGPAIAKPNRPEAERLLERSLLSEADAVQAAVEIRERGAGHLILSLGAQGAVAVWDGGILRASPPAAQTGSPIGAGDALGAACVWRLTLGDSFEEAFAWAVAAGTVSAGMPGLDSGGADEVAQMRKLVSVREIRPADLAARL